MLYRFHIELSDIDRGIYETLDFRVAQHPSETAPFLLTRVLAFALSFQEGLEFAPGGLGDPEAPALQAKGVHGAVDLWIEIGNPSARKLHKASKVARQVEVYTYKNAEALLSEIKENNVHRAELIKIYSFDAGFLAALENTLEKSNKWSLLLQQGQIDITIEGKTISTQLKKVNG
jgi:uncharacterized protein YaeQ